MVGSDDGDGGDDDVDGGDDILMMMEDKGAFESNNTRMI